MTWSVVAVVAVLFLAGVDACSPIGRPLAIEEEMLYAEQVMYAVVTKKFPGESAFDAVYENQEDLYTVTVNVYCILKGRRTPSIVNITDVGFIPGWCDVTSLSVGRSYVINAHWVEGNNFRPRKTYEADFSDLADYTRACGLVKMYPFGVVENGGFWTCPTPAPPGECLDEDDFPPIGPIGPLIPDYQEVELQPPQN